MKEWDYDTLNGSDWWSIPKEEQLSILEKYYPIDMYIKCGKDSGKILGYGNMNFILVSCDLDHSFNPCYIKPDLQRNRLDKLKKLGI